MVNTKHFLVEGRHETLDKSRYLELSGVVVGELAFGAGESISDL